MEIARTKRTILKPNITKLKPGNSAHIALAFFKYNIIHQNTPITDNTVLL